MTKFAFIYSGGAMAETPEAQQTEMKAWTEWFGSLGGAVADIGNPFGASTAVSGDGVADAGALGASGYSLVTAESLAAAAGLAKGCPIIASGGAVDVYEALEM